MFCFTVAQKCKQSIRPKFDKEIEKIVFKEGNRPLKNNVSLVIFVYNIVSRLFSPWFTDVHCKNMNVEHPDPVLVYAQS